MLSHAYNLQFLRALKKCLFIFRELNSLTSFPDKKNVIKKLTNKYQIECLELLV